MQSNTSAALVYPHQLFNDNPALNGVNRVFLIEEPLLFTQFQFHKQKLVLHRASMKFYADHLTKNGYSVRYVEFDEIKTTEDVAKILISEKVKSVTYCELTDDWLSSRLATSLKEVGIDQKCVDSPMFINSAADIEDYFHGKKRFSMAAFYQKERERSGILMTAEGGPVGGKFSFDSENRRKLPKNIWLPTIKRPDQNSFVEEAVLYVESNFSANYGDASEFAYPTTFAESELWLQEFLRDRLIDFGAYEDAISQKEDFIFHGVLTPMLNIGLLTPKRVIDAAIEFADGNEVPLNSLEGFIRQIIGWREFMRGVYSAIGRKQRSTNYWQHDRKLPASFWSGTTGIGPLDDTVIKVNRNAYNHHIERLMIVGNFMMLAEIDPHDSYKWFMEMYIDAYDWVMVPNVYGMSQQSDGGSIVTKPYISGSNYIRKMSDYGAGDWCGVWDGLYWRFIAKHEAFFRSNYRLSMMPMLLAKMDADKRERLMNSAENFLNEFSG